MNETSKSFLTPVLVSVAVTPGLLWVGWVSAGLGHGSYLWARILFPYVLFVQSLLPPQHQMGMLAFTGIAIMQYPLYGVVLGWARVKAKTVAAVAVLLLIHVALVGLLFTVFSGLWSGS